MANVKMLDGKYCKDEELRDGISEVKAYIGYPDDNVLGLAADFENSTFNRLGAAKGLNAGSDFNAFKMYGERKLCNLADDGTITAWYGDPNYTETGYTTIVDPDTQEESTIQVQVMVRQPKFYYKVVPIKLEPITSTDPTQTGVHGYSGVKMNYYISDKPLPGFKLHPAFINTNGDEVDCYYIGAYEACLYDVSENEYRLYDSWDVSYNESTHIYTVNALNTYLADKDYDKLSSIAGAKPASGDYSTQFTRPNVNTMAQNRGTRWGSLNIKIVSAEQLLMVIEYGGFNMQTSIGRGVVDYSTGSHNVSAFTGSTASNGNGSGSATSTVRLQNNGTLNTYTSSGYVSIRYRGVEDFWCNILTYADGINIYGDGTMESGEAYICDDFDYLESTNDNNYKPAGFTTCYGESGKDCIKYFGYSQNYDWVFLTTKVGGNTSLPVGDGLYSDKKENGYDIYCFGGWWGSKSYAGPFYINQHFAVGYNGKNLSARLCYV